MFCSWLLGRDLKQNTPPKNWETQHESEGVSVVYFPSSRETWRMFCVCVLLRSEKRVGNVYSKAKSFVDYVRRALRRLELDESQVGTRITQSTFPEKSCGGKIKKKSWQLCRRKTLVLLAGPEGENVSSLVVYWNIPTRVRLVNDTGAWDCGAHVA